MNAYLIQMHLAVSNGNVLATYKNIEAETEREACIKALLGQCQSIDDADDSKELRGSIERILKAQGYYTVVDGDNGVYTVEQCTKLTKASYVDDTGIKHDINCIPNDNQRPFSLAALAAEQSVFSYSVLYHDLYNENTYSISSFVIAENEHDARIKALLGDHASPEDEQWQMVEDYYNEHGIYGFQQDDYGVFQLNSLCQRKVVEAELNGKKVLCLSPEGT